MAKKANRDKSEGQSSTPDVLPTNDDQKSEDTHLNTDEGTKKKKNSSTKAKPKAKLKKETTKKVPFTEDIINPTRSSTDNADNNADNNADTDDEEEFWGDIPPKRDTNTHKETSLKEEEQPSFTQKSSTKDDTIVTKTEPSNGSDLIKEENTGLPPDLWEDPSEETLPTKEAQSLVTPPQKTSAKEKIKNPGKRKDTQEDQKADPTKLKTGGIMAQEKKETKAKEISPTLKDIPEETSKGKEKKEPKKAKPKKSPKSPTKKTSKKLTEDSKIEKGVLTEVNSKNNETKAKKKINSSSKNKKDSVPAVDTNDLEKPVVDQPLLTTTTEEEKAKTIEKPEAQIEPKKGLLEKLRFISIKKLVLGIVIMALIAGGYYGYPHIVRLYNSLTGGANQEAPSKESLLSEEPLKQEPKGKILDENKSEPTGQKSSSLEVIPANRVTIPSLHMQKEKLGTASGLPRGSRTNESMSSNNQSTPLFKTPWPREPNKFIVVETEIHDVYKSKTNPLKRYIKISDPNNENTWVVAETSTPKLVEFIDSSKIKAGDKARITLSSPNSQKETKYKREREAVSRWFSTKESDFFSIEEYELVK
jgi:hypothetical protein